MEKKPANSYGSEGRAQLMAEHGDELISGGSGLARLPLGGEQLALLLGNALAFAQVDHGDLEAAMRPGSGTSAKLHQHLHARAGHQT